MSTGDCVEGEAAGARSPARGEFVGRAAVVTGAASGIGRCIARLLHARGAAVALLDIDGEAVRRLVGAWRSEERNDLAALECDVRELEAVRRAMTAAAGTLGRIDVLVNCAGIYPRAPAAAIDEALLRDVMAVNFHGAVYCTNCALPFMPRTPASSVVNIASGAAVRPIPGLAAYGASKAALIAYSRALASELAPHVRVNVVSPGPTRTLTPESPAHDVEATRDRHARFASETPMGRLAEPIDVAEAVAYFASERSGFVTGQNLHVSGGRYMP